MHTLSIFPRSRLAEILQVVTSCFFLLPNASHADEIENYSIALEVLRGDIQTELCDVEEQCNVENGDLCITARLVDREMTLELCPNVRQITFFNGFRYAYRSLYSDKFFIPLYYQDDNYVDGGINEPFAIISIVASQS